MRKNTTRRSAVRQQKRDTYVDTRTLVASDATRTQTYCVRQQARTLTTTAAWKVVDGTCSTTRGDVVPANLDEALGKPYVLAVISKLSAQFQRVVAGHKKKTKGNV